MKPYYQQDKWVTIYHGDCREILPQLDKASAIVTDPPYELGFMGKSWDSKGVSFQPETWEIIRKSCLSGAPLLSFGGTRTFHRIACAIEDAGWEIRDTLMWVYGSGFPKSLDIGKAIDKLQGNERETVSHYVAPDGHWRDCNNHKPNEEIRNPETHYGYKTSGFRPLDKGNTAWEGYGTALKPAYEPIILAMNPLDGTFANNALKHGVAGLNIDECRIGYLDGEVDFTKRQRQQVDCGEKGWTGNVAKVGSDIQMFKEKGRFPANFIHDGSQMVMELFPDSKSSPFKSKTTRGKRENTYNQDTFDYSGRGYVDNGSAARFFYCAKASKAERDRGCEEMPEIPFVQFQTANGTSGKPSSLSEGRHTAYRNNHPTVKPLALMTYLVKLVKMPEYNLITDPFMGSGTTLLACIKLGIPGIGIDNDEKSCEIAAKRCCQEVMELDA